MDKILTESDSQFVRNSFRSLIKVSSQNINNVIDILNLVRNFDNTLQLGCQKDYYTCNDIRIYHDIILFKRTKNKIKSSFVYGKLIFSVNVNTSGVRNRWSVSKDSFHFCPLLWLLGSIRLGDIRLLWIRSPSCAEVDSMAMPIFINPT